VTLLVVWTGFPFIAVSVLAGLRTIPSELHESARVDGAGGWRIFWQVTYPLMRPIFQLLFLLSVIWDFAVFTQVYIIIGELGQRDEYNLGIYEYATAAAFILTIILLIVTVGYVRASVKEGALT
jgi:N,N'-diacetylchitobiose transport system permease protein